MVQETVAHLGELNGAGQARAEQLARRISGHASQEFQRHLFDTAKPAQALAVKLDEVRLERSRSFGAVWMGWVLWQALRLDELLEELMREGREKVPWAQVIGILAVGRLCEPSSELHLAERWYRSTALEDVLGISGEQIYDERLYRALDRVLEHKEAIEQHMVKRLGELFEISYDLLLYDVTSTYFEGVADPELAKRGYSRDHRPDCVQVCIGLVVTPEGLPLAYEVFDGNRTDVTTVDEIVETMRAKYGHERRVWVMDRGMVSADNLSGSLAPGGVYVVGTARSVLKRFAKRLAEETDWRQFREDVEVKICPGTDRARRSCCVDRKAAWRKKMRCMSGFPSASKKGLILCADASKRAGPFWNEASWNVRSGGCWKETHGRPLVIRWFSAGTPSKAAKLQLEWNIRSEWEDWAKLSEGTYILRSNIQTWTDQELWKTYVQLSEAEAAFRIHKSDLCLRPIWHHKQDRIKAHILICFLAYAMWKTLQKWQSQAGLGDCLHTILTELSRINSADVILPLAEHSKREIRLRCVVRPEREQRFLLQRLGLTLPQRLSLNGQNVVPT